MKSALKELQQIPGIGPSISRDLLNIGVTRISDLKDKNPQRLYNKICEFKGQQIDRCLLYTMRCAVYYASRKKHDPEKLKWWNWKD